MAFLEPRSQPQSSIVLAASGTSLLFYWYFPTAHRIVRYWAIPSAAEAAHATQELSFIFATVAADGTVGATVATLTNNSGTANTTKILSSAWVANAAKVIDCGNRPGSPTNVQNAWDTQAAGTSLKCTMAKAAGTTSGMATVGIDTIPST